MIISYMYLVRVKFFLKKKILDLKIIVGKNILFTCQGLLKRKKIQLHNIFFVQGKAISLAESFFGAGTIFGPSLGGFLYEMGGFQTPFLVAGTVNQ